MKIIVYVKRIDVSFNSFEIQYTNAFENCHSLF